MKVIYVPTVSVNENEVKLIGWYKKSGDFVKKNEIICDVETTKSTYDIESEAEGYLYYILEEGVMIKVGEPLAIIAEKEEKDYSALFDKIIIPKADLGITPDAAKRRFTKKAELIAAKAGIGIEDIATDESLITEDILNRHIESEKSNIVSSAAVTQMESIVDDDLVDSIHPVNRQERVLILGAGGGCNLVLDIITRLSHQRAEIILDSNKSLHNKHMMGVKVLGSIDLIEELWAAGKFDAVISTIVKDNDERKEIFETLISKGIPFTNIIDITANIRSNVKMGKGNLIVSGCYLAPSVTIGNNNFLAAYTAIEHHSLVGSHCTFGPRFTASGKVSIGDSCKFGTGIFVEPFVKIGNNTTIASGAIVTGHIPENSIVKTESRLHIKPKQK
jgi:sugar O-acyltransferase (sialic acid O-acetyltransferase NeuD family)